MNTARAVKIGMAWTTIVWTICYLAVGLIPGLGSAMVRDLAHMNVGPVERIFTIGNFIAGLISWNLIVAAGIALARFLGNYIKG